MNNLLSQLQTFNPLQIDQQVTQNALLRGQLENQRLAAMQVRQAYADDQTARNALMQSGGDNDKYLSNLANAGATKAYGERLKANKDLAVSQADIKHKEALAAQEQTKSVLNTSQAKAKDYEVELQKHAQHVNELGAVQTPTDAMAWMLKGKTAFPEMFNDQAIMQMTQKLMASPEAFQQWKQGAMMGGVKVEEQLKLAQARAIADQSNTTSIENNKRTNQTHITTTSMNNAVAMRGQNMVDARTRESNSASAQSSLADAGGLDYAEMNKRFGKPPPGYRWKPDGSQEPIPGGLADKKANEQMAGKDTVDSVAAQLRSSYDALDKGGGITSTNKGAFNNIGATISSSSVGQVAGGAVGSRNQKERDAIAQARPLLLQSIMKATGMSAKQMDSNAELKLWLATATDPTKSLEANKEALDRIVNLYGTGSTGKPAPNKRPSLDEIFKK